MNVSKYVIEEEYSYRIVQNLVRHLNKEDYCVSRETMPPIVLGYEFNDGEEFIVVDCNHRVQVTQVNNEQEILAFVPIGFTKYFN